MLFKTATSRNIFAVVATGLLATALAAGTLFSLSYSEIKRRSIAEMNDAAKLAAGEIQSRMADGIQLVHTLQNSFAGTYAAGGIPRSTADAILKTNLENTPFALGVWTGWEPNAFDGKDADFVNKPGHDATGRYVPYWVRSGGSIALTPLVDYDKPGPGDYYVQPFTQQKAVVIEPYKYTIDGKDVLMTSLAAPLTVGGKQLGVVGMDMALDSLAATLARITPLGDGHVALLSQGGSFISDVDPNNLGKALKDSSVDAEAWKNLIASPGTAMETRDASGVSMLSIAVPVNILPDTSWYAVVSVPKATVFAYLTRMAWISAAIIVVALVLLVLLGTLISGRFRKRIEAIVTATTGVAEGRTDIVLADADRKDELGDMARALAVLRDATVAKQRLEREAEENRALTEEERRQRAEQAAEQERQMRFAVSELGAGLQQLAEGNMTFRLASPFIGSLDSLRENFNASMTKLQEALRSVGANAQGIHAGSSEMRSAADDLAKRTESQAASVEETAAALEQITTSVKDAALRAEEAGQLVATARSGAQDSSVVVRKAIEAVAQIENSSREISNIIGVIDDIAFQTNLLALNAGVEAARAGDAGKGFAVVAQEVRELAQRSANAAKEIKSLISNSGEQVKTGVTLVGNTGVALDTIVKQVDEINLRIRTIIESAREQSVGLQDINRAVTMIDQGTQQNAAMVEQSTAASHALAGEATALTALLSTFRLGETASLAATGTHGAPVASRADAAPQRRPAAPARAPEPVSTVARAVASPARALGQKLASAFGGGNIAPTASKDGWDEF